MSAREVKKLRTKVEAKKTSKAYQQLQEKEKEAKEKAADGERRKEERAQKKVEQAAKKVEKENMWKNKPLAKQGMKKISSVAPDACITPSLHLSLSCQM
ncbi:hypothetical protein BT69DRAFT_1338306 [Atractiella rhizophila]|nr:hypothetical protein BT69DRAFT_1338306 [Atractiella rhizophila]